MHDILQALLEYFISSIDWTEKSSSLLHILPTCRVLLEAEQLGTTPLRIEIINDFML